MFNDIYFLLNASKLCFIVSAAFAVLAIVIFFVFDIRNLILIQTGRAQRRTIQEMNERHQKTGTLRREDDSRSTGSSGSKTKKTDSRKKEELKEKTGQILKIKKSEPSIDMDFGGNTARTGNNYGRQVVEDVIERSQGSLDTAVLFDSPSGESFSFRITQKIIVTHTDEMISA